MNLLRKYITRYENVVWLVIWIVSFLLLREVHVLAAPIILVTVIVLGLLYSLFITNNYRRGKLNYIVFKTYNDEYAGFEGLFFGAALLIGSGLMLYFNFINVVWFSMSLLVATLLFLNNFYSMPSGFLKFKLGLLRLYGVSGAIEVENIKSIEIYNNRIVIKSLDGKVWLASSLKIEEANADELIWFLNEKLADYPIEITNQVIYKKNEKGH